VNSIEKCCHEQNSYPGLSLDSYFFCGPGHLTTGIKFSSFLLLILLDFMYLMLPGSALKFVDFDQNYL